MSAAFYDITTASQLSALTYLVQQIDIQLGYLAADGVTATPKQGRDGWAVGGVNPPVVGQIGQTTHWTAMTPHPTIVGRYCLYVDAQVSAGLTSSAAALQALVKAGTATPAQATLLTGLNTLPAPVALDPTWTAVAVQAAGTGTVSAISPKVG